MDTTSDTSFSSSTSLLPSLHRNKLVLPYSYRLQLYALISRTPGGDEFFAQYWVRPLTWVFGRIVINVSMAFAFLTFGLVKKEIWIGVGPLLRVISFSLSASQVPLLLRLHLLPDLVARPQPSPYKSSSKETKGAEECEERRC